MKPAFRDIAADGPLVSVRVDGRAVAMRSGANLAAGLLAAGVLPFRHTPVSGAPRGPYCMMGVCFDCLVEVGGVTRQACMMEAREGLEIFLPKVRPDG